MVSFVTELTWTNARRFPKKPCQTPEYSVIALPRTDKLIALIVRDPFEDQAV